MKSGEAVAAPAGPVRANVLVLSLYYAPELTGNASLVTELTRQLAARGLAVRVVREHLTIVFPRFRGRTDDDPRCERCSGALLSRDAMATRPATTRWPRSPIT